MPMPEPRPFTFAPLEVTFHRVEAKVRDQVATTAVDQEFYNPNDRQLEGTYIFPVPKGVQIDKFSMDVNGKQMEAELLPPTKRVRFTRTSCGSSRTRGRSSPFTFS
jgi:Ca-activated chloride channel family protein